MAMLFWTQVCFQHMQGIDQILQTIYLPNGQLVMAMLFWTQICFEHMQGIDQKLPFFCLPNG